MSTPLEPDKGGDPRVAAGFEQIAGYLAEIDLPGLWETATDGERRVTIGELLDGIEVHADHLERHPGRGWPQVSG